MKIHAKPYDVGTRPSKRLFDRRRSAVHLKSIERNKSQPSLGKGLGICESHRGEGEKELLFSSWFLSASARVRALKPSRTPKRKRQRRECMSMPCQRDNKCLYGWLSIDGGGWG